MPPTPSRLYELLIACGFTPAQLESITQTSMGIGLDAITTSTDPADRALAVVRFAEKYGLILPLTATILTSGADRPALQNVLLDDNMTLEDGRTAHSTALDLVRLEGKVERLGDRVNELANVVGNLSHVLQGQGASRQPVAIGGKVIAGIVLGLGALVTAQITLLAWLGALPHG